MRFARTTAPRLVARPEAVSRRRPSEPATHYLAPASLRRLRKPLLLSVFLAEAIALLWLLPTDPLLARQTYLFLHPARSKVVSPDDLSRLKKDPRLHSDLPKDGAGERVRQKTPHSNVGYLLVPVGECASCISVDLRAWQRAASERGLSMVVVSSAPAERTAEFLHDMKLAVPVVFDPSGKLTRQLNVVWTARPYLFSPDWRLIWLPRTYRVQYNPLEEPEFEKALKGANG